MALETGKPPLHLLDDGFPGSWSELDLEVLSQWRRAKGEDCSGCGRPLEQHLHNSILGREETPDDYTPISIDCPAVQSISAGQEMWRNENKAAIDSHSKGKGPDPGAGIFWTSKGSWEKIPKSLGG